MIPRMLGSMFESITGLTLQDPWLLLLALLVPIALLVRWRRGAPAVVFGPGTFVERPLPGSWRTRLLPVPRVLQTLGILLAVLALARPVHRVPLPITTEGIDIFLCLDVSSSMAMNDMDQRRTRLEVAKDTAAQFIAGRPNDRIGLIAFARYPDVVCPLTLDHAALTKLLGGLAMVEPDGPEDATGIGTAVARAAQVLGGSTGKSKVVILITDGEENVATRETPDEIGPQQAARIAAELGVRVYAIAAGIGTPDQSGKWIAIDTTQVERLARKTGGEFSQARDAGALTGVYKHINQLETVALDAPRYRVDEKFLPFLLAGLALLLVSRVLKATVLEVLP
jgi:Ca-activated chloride channel homolog